MSIRVVVERRTGQHGLALEPTIFHARKVAHAHLRDLDATKVEILEDGKPVARWVCERPLSWVGGDIA